MTQIIFDNVDLIYPIRENRAITLKEFIVRGIFWQRMTKKPMEIHALKNISFRIDPKERVGIIGHNGSGKSTLLRTIAGVYPIASGQRIVDGNIYSLFEISVGFEHGATGWDNIYFRSYFQGETPQCVRDKLDSIAKFTELGDFLNVPLNCYSSGMITRLGFAIATSGRPEILLIDEVFSTGDAVFREKAKARMIDFMDKANIVVMVGHDMNFFETFCTRTLWLERGVIKADGPPKDVIADYLNYVKKTRSSVAA